MSRKLVKKEPVEKEIKEENMLELIKKHHLIIWLLLFFPVALYKIYKYKIFPKWTRILITIFFVVCLIAIVDTILNPTRIEDNKIRDEIEAYDVGTIFTLEQYDTVDNTYYVYDLITSTGRYDVYFSTDHKIEAIKQIERQHKDIYIADDFPYKDVFSEIIRHIDGDSNISFNFEEIVSEDLGTQVIKIDGKEYTFIVSLEAVALIYLDGETIYENSLPSIRMPQEIFEKASKKFSQVKNLWYVSGIDFTDKNYSIIFYTEDGGMFQFVVYEDGMIEVNVAKTNN